MSSNLMVSPSRPAPDGSRADLVVLVDPSGRSVGVADRLKVHTEHTPLHLGFSCYIVDSDDRLLLTRRSRDKRTFPGVWTNSVCGHPAPGESLAAAVHRRAAEELGLGLRSLRLVLPEFSYRAEMGGLVENELCPVLVAVGDGLPAPDPAEVADAEWVPWSAFVSDVQSGRRTVSPWCREQVAQLAPLGPPSAWPRRDPDRLPAVLRPERSERPELPSAPETSRIDLDHLRRRIDTTLLDFVDRESRVVSELDPAVSILTDAARVAVEGGKRLRASFAYLGWLGAGREPDPAVLSAAASLELLHSFALVHDDVMDGSERRRSLPSVHARLAALHEDAGWSGTARSFGVSGAILVGDLCLTWADQLLYGCGLQPEALARAKPVYDEMRTELMAGQCLDLVAQAEGAGGVDRALKVAFYKTATYTAVRPLLLGAALAGAPDELLQTYRRYGEAVGLAFQLRDDVLGAFGDPAVTGKPSGEDIRDAKRTVLVARAFERADVRQRAVLEAQLGRPDLDVAGLTAVRAVLRDCGALAEVERQIGELAEQARSEVRLGDLPPAVGRALLELVELMTVRSC